MSHLVSVFMKRTFFSFFFYILFAFQSFLLNAQQAAMTAIPEAPSNVSKEEVVKRPRAVKNSEDFFNAKEYAEAIDHLKKAYSKVKTREEKAEIQDVWQNHTNSPLTIKPLRLNIKELLN